MTSNLTQKGMIITFVGSNKGDFYWRLKNLKLRAIRNPEDETAHTAKHKRVLPILTSVGREHEHEILTFLAVLSFKLTFHIQWEGEVMYLYEKTKTSSYSKSASYVVSAFNK